MSFTSCSKLRHGQNNFRQSELQSALVYSDFRIYHPRMYFKTLSFCWPFATGFGITCLQCHILLVTIGILSLSFICSSFCFLLPHSLFWSFLFLNSSEVLNPMMVHISLVHLSYASIMREGNTRDKNRSTDISPTSLACPLTDNLYLPIVGQSSCPFVDLVHSKSTYGHGWTFAEVSK